MISFPNRHGLRQSFWYGNLYVVLVCDIVIDPVPYLCKSLEGVRILKAVQYLPPGKSSRPFFTTTPAPPGWLVAPTGVCGSDILIESWNGWVVVVRILESKGEEGTVKGVRIVLSVPRW